MQTLVLFIIQSVKRMIQDLHPKRWSGIQRVKPYPLLGINREYRARCEGNTEQGLSLRDMRLFSPIQPAQTMRECELERLSLILRWNNLTLFASLKGNFLWN